MSDKKLEIIPMLDDLLGAGVSAGVAGLRGKSPGRCAAEQLASAMVAKNVANYTAFTDGMTSDALQVPINETDMLTGVVRAGWSMYKGRSSQENIMEGLGGVLASVMGRELRKSFFPSASAP